VGVPCRASSGETLVTDGGQGYSAKSDARDAFEKLEKLQAEHYAAEQPTVREHRRQLHVGGSHLLGYDHAPRVDEQLPQFLDIDGVESDLDPSVPHVG